MTKTLVTAALLVAGLTALACASTGARRASLWNLSEADMDPAAGYERPPTMRASELWPATTLVGPHYQVRDEVATDGFLRIYTVDSDFGGFHAVGDLALRNRLQELRALTALEALREGPEVAAAEAAAERHPLVASYRLASHPTDSMHGVPARAWDEVMRIDHVRPTRRSNAELETRRAVIAFEEAKVRVARRLGANPFSPTLVFQRELNRFGWLIAAGGLPLESLPSLADSSLAPVATDVLSADRVERLTRHPSPEDLRRGNQLELTAMGLDAASIEAFLAHPAYSLRHETGLVEGLASLETTANRKAYIEIAMRATTPADAEFYMMGALTLQAFHTRIQPIEKLVTLDGIACAAFSDGRLAVPALVDHVIWTAPTDRFARILAEARPEGLAVTSRELWLSGNASPKARAGFAAQGLTLYEGIFERVFQRLGDGPEDSSGTAPAEADE